MTTHDTPPSGQFQKGKKGGPGRPKGTQNKVNKELKDMILGALEASGGVQYLVERANDPKTASAFLTLIGKVLPMTIAGDSKAPLTFRLDAPWLTQQIAQRNAE